MKIALGKQEGILNDSMVHFNGLTSTFSKFKMRGKR